MRDNRDEGFLENLHSKTRTVFIGDGPDGIDHSIAENVIKSFHILSQDDRPIKVYLNSFGGCWYNGMAIYDMINQCPCHVTAYVIGSAMSMGSVILQAADHRVIYPSAIIMIHDGMESAGLVNPQTFQNWASQSKKASTLMYQIYAERSGHPISFWKRKCSSDFIVNAEEALDLGLVDEIHGRKIA